MDGELFCVISSCSNLRKTVDLNTRVATEELEFIFLCLAVEPRCHIRVKSLKSQSVAKKNQTKLISKVSPQKVSKKS